MEFFDFATHKERSKPPFINSLEEKISSFH